MVKNHMHLFSVNGKLTFKLAYVVISMAFIVVTLIHIWAIFTITFPQAVKAYYYVCPHGGREPAVLQLIPFVIVTWCLFFEVKINMRGGCKQCSHVTIPSASW